MAYPTVVAPYGLKPVNLIGGRVFAGSTRSLPIVNGYSTSLYNGDVVQLGTGANIGALVASGITYNSTSAVAGTIGVFVGCEYSSTGGPIYGKNRYQYWLGGTAATDATGYVVDDPQAVFQVAVVVSPAGTGGSTTLQYINPAFIGSNAYYIGNAAGNTGSTTTGDSQAGIAVSATATVSTPIVTASYGAFRIVGVVPASAVTVTSNATSSSTTITLSSSNSAITPGMAVNGPGILQGSNTYVTAVSGTSVTINTAVTTAQSTAAQFSFTGYPEALVTWNFGYHSYFNATGV